MTTLELSPRARIAALEGEVLAWKRYGARMRRDAHTVLRLLLKTEHRSPRPEYPQEVLQVVSEMIAYPSPQS